MKNTTAYTLINEQNNHLAFKIFSFDDHHYFDHLQRNNYYTVLWVQTGEGLLKVDFSEHVFTAQNLLTFAPYQPFMLSTNQKTSGVAIQFHADFYCIHRNPKETNCDTVLFNNIYDKPLFKLEKADEEKFNLYVQQLKDEFTQNDSGNFELIIPSLKLLLGTASRLKLKALSTVPSFVPDEVPYVLQQLKSAIETHFKSKHQAREYADVLNISANALSKLVKTHYHKTLTQLIIERVIIEAKRELYMTTKPIKEIAWSLGYEDEYYFSRVFKKHTETSPQLYRDTVGFGKAEME